MNKFYLLFVAMLIAALPLRADIVDELTAANVTFASTSSGYQNFTVTAANSGATYSGNANKQTTKFQFKSATSGIYVSKVPDGLKLKSISLTYNTSDGGTGTLSLYGSTSAYTSFSDITGTALMTTTSAMDASYTFSSNETAFALIGGNNKASYWSKIIVTWAEVEQEGVVSKPSITGPSDVFFDDSEVTIETATEGASIYYLLDSEETPSATNGTLYKGAITIPAGKTTTVSAIAVKEGLTDSEVNTKTFVGGTTFASIAALKAGEPVDGTKYRINGPIAVVYVSTAKGDILLTDGTDATSGIFVYDNAAAKKTTLTAGATISNVVGTYSYGTYTIRPQFTIDAYTLGDETTEVTPKLYESADELIATENYNQYVRLEGQTVDESMIGGIKLFDRYGLNVTYDEANTYDIEGIYVIYSSSTYELLPTSVSIHKVETTEKPEITSVTFGETEVKSDDEISAWPGETIDITASNADSITITVTADEDTTTTIEGASGEFALPDVAEAIISIFATNSNGDSESVDFTYTEKEPETLVATYNGSALENGGEYEVALGGVITLTAKGATDFIYLVADADDIASATDGKITINAFGEYTIDASNAAGYSEIKVTLTEAPKSVYSLVTSTDEITSDAKYIIAASSVGKAMGTINSSNAIKAVDATYDAEQSTISVAAGQAAEFVITAVDGGYTFAYGEQYLSPTSSTSTNLNFSNTSKTLTVSFDTSYNATITVSGSSRGVIYNSSTGFKHYATTNATQSGYAYAQLYKYIGMEGDIPGEGSGINEVTAEPTNLTGAEYYGLNGIRVAASRLTPGLYIVRLPNGTARTTLVK
jgi:hypothetical protein